MIKRSALIAFCLSVAFGTPPVFSQTSADINKLVTKSKLVDTGRPVNSNVSGNQASISTFTSPKASDRDCKVTALLMMKEINSKYHQIDRIRVLFFDPVRTDSYRQLDVKQAHVQFVDSGEGLDMVLGTIDIEKLMVPKKRTAAARADIKVPSRMTAMIKQLAPAVISYDNFTAPDGSVSFVRPRNWLKEISLGSVAKYGGLVNGHYGSLAVYKYPFVQGVTTLESLADLHEEQERAQFSNYRRHALRSQSCAGNPGLYYEASADLPTGTRGSERSIIITAGNQCYLLMMMSDSAVDHEMQNIFNTVTSSMRIR